MQRDALGETTAATYEQISATKELTDPLYALAAANERLVAAEDEYNTALFTSGVNSKEAETAAIDLTKAQQDANIAAAHYAEEGGPASVEELRKLAEQAGLSDAAIDRLIGTIGRANSSTVKIPTRTYGRNPKSSQKVESSKGPEEQRFRLLPTPAKRSFPPTSRVTGPDCQRTSRSMREWVPIRTPSPGL